MSATSPGRGRSAPAKSRGGASAAHARSSDERGVAVFRRATSSRLSRTMASRMLIASEVPARSLTLQRFEREAADLLEDVIADGARRREVAHDATALHQRLQQRFPVALATRTRT